MYTLKISAKDPQTGEVEVREGVLKGQAQRVIRELTDDAHVREFMRHVDSEPPASAKQFVSADGRLTVTFVVQLSVQTW